jgi:hypothetical protein
MIIVSQNKINLNAIKSIDHKIEQPDTAIRSDSIIFLYFQSDQNK